MSQPNISALKLNLNSLSTLQWYSFRLNLWNCGLETVADTLLQIASAITLRGNPLQCGCVKSMIARFKHKLVDVSLTKCFTSNGSLQRYQKVWTDQPFENIDFKSYGSDGFRELWIFFFCVQYRLVRLFASKVHHLFKL